MPDFSNTCNHVDSPVGGRLRSYFSQWRKLTSDPFILNAVQGYELEFEPELFPPKQMPVYKHAFSAAEIAAIDVEIQKLHEKGVIEHSVHENHQYISPIFTRPKKDGGTRMILDLSQLNQNLQKNHFKMDTFSTAIQFVSQNSYMASIDLRDAYYSVPIAKAHRKFLKFTWKNQLWQYKALPNGLSTAPRLFTKILKPVFAHLRSMGHTVLGYIDDTIIIEDTVEAAHRSIAATTQLLSELGFIIHPVKSILDPTHELKYLGFVINSSNMSISLPEDKVLDIIYHCTELESQAMPTIRQVARVIGKLVSIFPAVQVGPMYYRSLERDKIQALRDNKGHYDRKMILSSNSKRDLRWWILNLTSFAHAPISQSRPHMEICTDASGMGWGATDSVTHIGGRWNEEEMGLANDNNINYLELLAVFHALKSFCSKLNNVHVLVRIDNTTAVSYIKNMGGIKSRSCDHLAKHIWQWCMKRQIWLSAAHLPGRENVIADTKSRHFNDQLEWKLNILVFNKIVQQFGMPSIDLFASRLNNQLHKYVAWQPDPEAFAIDAFSLDWGRYQFYAFPPFCLIGRCLQKIKQDQAEGVIVVPNWPTQAWYPILVRMLVAKPILVHRHPQLLLQPVSSQSHPLYDRIDILCCRLSGKPLRMQDYHSKQWTLFQLP